MRPTTYEEVDDDLIQAVRTMVDMVKKESTEHWERTPERFARYLTHLRRPEDYDRWTSFVNSTGSKNMVVVPGIWFWSACAHHLLPFMGTIDVGYIPNRSIIGLSKIPLLVREVARGFWMQEDLTSAISSRFSELIDPAGIAVRIKAKHTCQLLDVGPPVPTLITTEMHGLLLHNPSAKQEFLEACLG